LENFSISQNKYNLCQSHQGIMVLEKNNFKSRLLNNLGLFLFLFLIIIDGHGTQNSKVFLFWKFMKISLSLVIINKIVLGFQFET
jgi:hypothetical protein